MTAAQSRPLWPADFTEEALIWQATGIIMSRFDLDTEEALEVLRRMSQCSNNPLCAVAEQVIRHDDPVRALQRLEEDRFSPN